MSMKRTLPWIAGVAMLACALLAHSFRPVASVDAGFKLDAVIPSQFSGWRIDPSVVPIAPTPDVQANLDKIYDQILSRAYVNSKGERVMLVIAYGGDQSDSMKAHRQEVCYAAQGFSIRSVRNDTLDIQNMSVPLVRVDARKGQRSEPISYWFTMGEQVATGRVERLLAQIGYGLVGRIPDGMLVRVSSTTADVVAAHAAQDAFMRSLLAAVSPEVQVRLAGFKRAPS